MMHAVKLVIAETRTPTFDHSKAAIRDALKDVVDVVDILEVPPHGKEAVAKALAYAIRSTVRADAVLTYKGETEELDFAVIERLIASEFWHSLNRKKLVKNEDVDESIATTYRWLGYNFKPVP